MMMLDRARAALGSIPRRFGRVDSRVTIPELDGLRFLAIAIVLVWHASLRAARHIDHLNQSGGPSAARLGDYYRYFPHGEIGVILFFFISGFVVSQPFLAKPREQWDIGGFYRRRLRRIYPPYLIAMTLCFVALGVVGHVPADANAFQQQAITLNASFLASLFYLHGIVFDIPSRLNPPMWSLEIEVLFYAVLPLLMLLYSRVRRRALRIGAISGLIATLVVASSVLIGSAEIDLRLRWGLFYHAYLFLMGILAADLVGDAAQRSRVSRLSFDAVFACGLAVLLGIGWMMTENDARMLDGVYALKIQGLTILAIVLVFAGALRGRYASAVLSLAWIRFIGTMCYSIYLTHIVAMTIVSEVLARAVTLHDTALIYAVYIAGLIGASLVAGTVFYICAERPFARHVAKAPRREASQSSVIAAISRP